MKIRDSAMPEQAVWDQFFDAPTVLQELQHPSEGDVVDIGCGFGTFSVAAAALTAGTVHALDIDSEMIAATNDRARRAGYTNVKPILRDVAADGTGLPDGSVAYVMLFNILHAEDAPGLLREAFRILSRGGCASIIHWVHDARTPRGPALDIRPRPQQCRDWAASVGFIVHHPIVQLPPHHFGLVAQKPPGSPAGGTLP
ncbi:MAG TPA: class I SAM-dependent methyltransferase [Steroidobacteraceae bacterium]|nr:class I SAM-dependent methyltransferase [Steroidobacteraceae bacterium]